MVLLLVLTDNSPAAPVKLLFCAVVPRLNCTCVGIIVSVYHNVPKSVARLLPVGSIQLYTEAELTPKASMEAVKSP